MGAWDCLSELIEGCFDILCYPLEFGGITFNLFEVMVVSVGVWVGSLIWTGIVEGD